MLKNNFHGPLTPKSRPLSGSRQSCKSSWIVSSKWSTCPAFLDYSNQPQQMLSGPQTRRFFLLRLEKTPEKQPRSGQRHAKRVDLVD